MFVSDAMTMNAATIGKSRIDKVEQSNDFMLLKLVREKQGLCAECGARTHEFRVDDLGFRTKEPLTIEGRVRRGRCLVCHPIPSTGGGDANRRSASKRGLTIPTTAGANPVFVQPPPLSSVAVDPHSEHRRSARSSSAPRMSSFRSASLSTITTTESVRSVSSSGVTLKRIRERQGLCAECGARTHEFAPDEETGATVKRPLTVEGEVRRGRCLHCHPLPAAPLSAQQQPADGGSGAGALADVFSHTTPKASRGRKSTAGRSFSARTALKTLNRRNSFCSTTSAVSCVSSCDMDSIKSEHTSASVRAKRRADEEDAAVLRLSRLSVGTSDLCDIIATMRQYPANATIQEQGCHKLWSQSRDKSKSAAIGRVGGIPTIINAMRAHGPSQSLQLMGCEALQNLARNSDYNRQVIHNGGGVSAVLHGMEMHRRVVGVQVCGCAALAGIGARGGRSDDAAVLGALRGAIEAFPQEERVLRSAYKTLKALGFKPMEVLARWQEEKEGG